MEGTPKHGREYYRCVTRALATHVRTVHLAERAALPTLNAWLVACSTPTASTDRRRAGRLARDVADAEPADRENARLRLADVKKRLDRLTAAIDAGADPPALIESLNAAQAQRVAAQNELDAAGPGPEPADQGGDPRRRRFPRRRRCVARQGGPLIACRGSTGA